MNLAITTPASVTGRGSVSGHRSAYGHRDRAPMRPVAFPMRRRIALAQLHANGHLRFDSDAARLSPLMTLTSMLAAPCAFTSPAGVDGRPLRIAGEAADTRHLEELLLALAAIGPTTTSIILSSHVQGRPLLPALRRQDTPVGERT